MATNPMQRKARNSFLLGMLVMLLIAAVIIGFLFFQLKQKMDKEREEALASVEVYVLTQDVSSGQLITSDMYEAQIVNKNRVPSNAIADDSIIANYSLQDKSGNSLRTKYNNNEPTLYITMDNVEYKVEKEENTENYYITKNNNKQYLELDTVPIVAKVTMKANTVITTELLNRADSVATNDVRKQEYNMLVLPTDLATGDYVDIRLMLPNGQDYIVVSKKEVTIPYAGDAESPTTIAVNLSEDEILHMSNAIVDAFRLTSSKIYVTKYTEPGMQEAAKPTYVASAEVAKLLESDANILEKAMTELRARYNATATDLRNTHINASVNSAGTQGETNLETKMQESITNSQTQRKEYLDSLSGTTE